MSNNQENYRPRSPDLSEFVPHNKPRHLPNLPPYHTSDSSFPPGYAFSPRGSYDASPYFPPQTTIGSYFTTPSQASTVASPAASRKPSLALDRHYNSSLPRASSSAEILQPPPLQHPLSSPAVNSRDHQGSASTQHQFSSPYNPTAAMPTTRGKRIYYNEPNESEDEESADQAQTLAPAPPPAHRHQDVTAQAQPTAPLVAPSGPLELTLDVKTKFAVARIKRIMQADEDIGKVAQATPTAMAKALELFMVTLITKGAAEARGAAGGGGGGKRITAQHLKSALMADPQFDFLSEQCANVPDESAGGSGKKGRSKSEAKSEDSMEEDGAPPARKRGKGAAKKEQDD